LPGAKLTGKAKSVRLVQKLVRCKKAFLASGSKSPLLRLDGYVKYEGDFSPFAEPLDAMQKPHIGGTTSFGFGKIKIENAI